MTFLSIFKHLLPRARAWSITIDKNLRQFFEGLTGLGEDAKSFLDDVWLDVFPDTTRDLDSWEIQFALASTALSDADRRSRLDAAWKALGGQSPRYIQDTLQGAGFDVHVHEWWDPATIVDPGVKQCLVPRDPRIHLRREFTDLASLFEVGCGEALAQCGEAFAECGNGTDPRGYPLVNKVFTSSTDIFVLCGEVAVECGEAEALCGNYTEFRNTPINYIVPNDPATWPYFLYIGGESFPDLAQLPPSSRNEFEELCLKICPTQQWLGILVQFG